MVEFRGWWIVLDLVCWIFIAIVLGMAAFRELPSSPYNVIVLVALVLALIWSLLAWRSVRAGRRPPRDGGTS
jgi:uncharacterized membrane protein YfcA